MAKRGADKDLNHDNWDQDDDDEEEAGIFRHASKEVIEKREIKKAKRRTLNESSNAGTSALKGFSFGALNPSSAPFSFAPQTNAALTDANKTALSSFKFSSTAVSQPTIATTTASLASLTCSPAKSSAWPQTKEPESEYRRSLRDLNESVLCWINDHVKKNPYCILTPVFSDYEVYIKQLDSEFVVGTTSSKSTAPTFSFGSSSLGSASEVTSTQAPMFGAGFFNSGTKPAESTPMDFASTTAAATAAKGISFGATTTVVSSSGFGSAVSAGISSAPTFSFGVKSSKDVAAVPNTGFGQPTIEKSSSPVSIFAANIASSKEAPSTSKAFSFGTSSSVSSSSTPAAGGNLFGFSLPSTSVKENDLTQGTSQSEGGDDANYVPPKAEVVDIQEDDAFYTVKCKLYFKVGNEFKDRGVGNLYLKPCGEKTQLLVRASTALGNILLNIMLNKGIPSCRQGNKVSMVCIPNPPLSEKESDNKTAICMLLRVKTEEEAETLLKQIDDHKA